MDFIPYELSDFATGYLVAGASIGAAVGALAAGPLTDRYGRKSLLIVDAAIYAVGAILSALAVNAGMLIAARTLIGLAVGADSAIATAYICEFAPTNRLGSLTASGGPVKKLRRCADHVDQLALVPATEVKRLARWRGAR